MSTNNSQIGHSPSEILFQDNDSESNLHRLLSNEIIIVSQSQRQFSTTNRIPSQIPLISRVPEHDNIPRRQLGRRRRRQRRRQRRREYRERQQQARTERYRRLSDVQRDHDYWEYVGFPEYMEENLSPLLDAYDWERMDPNERQDRWEQEHLNEFERLTSLEQQEHLNEIERHTSLEQQEHLNEIERHTSLKQQEQLTLIADEMEQLQEIEIVQSMIDEQQQERNNQELIDLEQWEHIHFLLQQLTQPETQHR